MSKKAILAAALVVVIGLTGFVLFLTLGSGRTVYIPDDAALAMVRGEHFLNRRRHTVDRQKRAELLSQAIDKFNKALASKPDFEVAYNMLGHAYIERGQWEQALQYLGKALKLRQDYPAALYNRAVVYKRLSTGKRDNRLLNLAIKDFKQALKSKRAYNFIGDIHKSLADAYLQKGDYKMAIKELQTYLDKVPKGNDSVLIRRKIHGLELMEKGQAPLLE
jgi:tetratricopeptide (TPR) repeat protein